MSARDGEVLTVLLIEDDPEDAGTIRRAVGRGSRAMRLEHAARLSEGLARLAEGRIDVVVLDLSLPDGNGVDAFLTATFHAADVPFVVLAEPGDDLAGTRAVEAGALDHVVKGDLDADLLVDVVRDAWERHRTLQQLRELVRNVS